LTKQAGPADPDAYAALEEQRDFLLGSLDDLEREYEAGDIDDVDYRGLRDDYTARAAAVLRALEEGQARFVAARPERSWSRLIAIFAVVALLATGAGLLLARASGTRGSSDQISGDIRITNRDRLLQALDRLTAGEPVAALELYDEVLETDPDNAEALTYRGWTLALSQLPEDGLQWLDRAVEVDPDYPDARALRAVTLARFLDRPDDALADLDALDTDALAPDLAGLVEGLRSSLESGAGRSVGPTTTGDP
jgi:tetratricopeptide (TPR) repeat protein